MSTPETPGGDMSEPRTETTTIPRVHFTADNYQNADGHFAHCRCGEAIGPLPDIETLLDAVMDHAYWAGREDGENGSQEAGR